MSDGLSIRASRTDAVLQGIAQGRPIIGPSTVHIDVTNGCNAACVTCWDHSPLLASPRSADWKRRRLSLDRFTGLVDELGALGSVRAVVLSGMGDPLTHPHIYEMMALVKARGWALTLLSNLVAADLDRLVAARPDQLLVGVQGVTPRSYTAFHPGWTEAHFFRLCDGLRRLARAGVSTRHVQVINRDTAPELVDMVRFARRYEAERVNYKLASLAEGTEACAVTPEQLAWMRDEGVPAARALAAQLGVKTNLDLFEAQVCSGDALITTPIEDVGCYMGYLYTRITVDLDVLYCCNTAVRVGSLNDAPIRELWYGPVWQGIRDALAAGQYWPGCERCGKFEQNVKWSRKVRGAAAP